MIVIPGWTGRWLCFVLYSSISSNSTLFDIIHLYLTHLLPWTSATRPCHQYLTLTLRKFRLDWIARNSARKFLCFLEFPHVLFTLVKTFSLYKGTVCWKQVFQNVLNFSGCCVFTSIYLQTFLYVSCIIWHKL